MNRRDLMKLFGVGTVIAPIVGSSIIQGAQATLIEVPKIEPATPELLHEFFPSNPITGSSIRTIDPIPVWIGDQRKDWQVFRVGFRHSFEVIDITTSFSGGFREFRPGVEALDVYIHVKVKP